MSTTESSIQTIAFFSKEDLISSNVNPNETITIDMFAEEEETEAGFNDELSILGTLGVEIGRAHV